MANSANTYGDSLNAMFKETYADKELDLIPDGMKLYNAIKFMPKNKEPGLLYHQPVVLGLEHGMTFASATDDAFNLQAAVAGTVKDAQVRGQPKVLRSLLGYNAAQRAVQGGQAAFKDVSKYLVGNMLKSFTKKLEIELFYGQMGYATVASTSGAVITITTAEWAPGIWCGAEGMPIEIRDTTGATSRGNCTVTSVDLDARTITVDALPGGTTGTDVIWHKGAYGNEAAGIHKILTNSGTLFNISASTYNLWKGNSYSAGSAALSLAKVERALSAPVVKGLENKVTVYVNPKTWADLLVEQTALRMYDQSYSTSELVNGASGIKFHGPNGEVMVEMSIYVKEGYSYIVSLEDFIRVGSTDVTFKNPVNNDEYFIHKQDQAAYELRAYTDQALFCTAPGKSAVITAITNTA